MKCIIVDDEPLAREGMRLNVKEIESLELIGEFEDAIKANEFVNNNKVDLIFLDIQMPNITGIEFIKMLKNPPLIILTTAFPQFALESYELDIVDYLVKPIRFERFAKAVKKANDLHELTQSKTAEVESIEADYVYVKSERKYVKLFFDNIMYIEGLKDYVIIHTKDSKVVTAMNIKTINKQLPDSIFFRVNKSYVINIHKIKEIDTDFIIINKREIPIGRTYKDDFIKNCVNKYLIKR